MLLIAAYIATIFLIKIVLMMIPVDEDNKKLIMRVSGCFATAIMFLLYKTSGKEALSPLSPRLSQMSKSNSFSQASVFSGESLLSDF